MGKSCLSRIQSTLLRDKKGKQPLPLGANFTIQVGFVILMISESNTSSTQKQTTVISVSDN